MIIKNKEEGIKTMKIKNLKLIVAMSVLLVSSVFARELASSEVNSRASERVLNGENLSPGISVLNINNIAYWIGKDGAKGQPKLGAAQVDKGEKAKTDAPPSGGGTY